jgi:ribose transport system permease protein
MSSRRVPRPPILITLATLLLFRYGVSMMTHSRSYGPVPDAFYVFGTGWIPFLCFAAVAALFAFTTLRTRSGRWAIAIGGGEQAARLSGISTEAVKRWTYLLSGLCAGLAGLLATAYLNNAQASMKTGAELDAIAACVVGGVRITGGDGSIFGVMLGAILIALLQNVLVLTHRPEDQYGLFTGGIILAAAILEQWRLQQKVRKGAAA